MNQFYNTHGTGQFTVEQFKAIGINVIIEPGVLIFHPENISLGNNVYIGHYTILKGYHKEEMIIGDGTWIGQQCFFHSAGSIRVGCNVGIGPGVKIITSYHQMSDKNKAILHQDLIYLPVTIEDDADIGVGAIILPGVTIGKGSQVGAGAVVTANVEAYSVVAGVPARRIRFR